MKTTKRDNQFVQWNKSSPTQQMEQRTYSKPNSIKKPQKKIKIVNPTILQRDSQNKDKDWDIEHAFSSGYLSNHKIPNEISLHKASFLKEWSIHKQKAGSYSCIGYAVTDMIYWHLKQREAEENKELKEEEKLQRLSARFNWMAAKEIDSFTDRPTTFIEQEGSSLKAGLDVARKYGSVEDIFLPTDTNELFHGTARSFYAHAASNIINCYFNLLLPKTQFFETEREKQTIQILIWKKWLAENGPILVRVKVDTVFDQAKTSILKNITNTSTQQNMNYHAALLVGYRDKAFILRNSWGVDWGAKGYAYLDEAYALNHIDEAYGITVKSPHVKVGTPETTTSPEKPSIWDLILESLGLRT